MCSEMKRSARASLAKAVRSCSGGVLRPPGVGGAGGAGAAPPPPARGGGAEPRAARGGPPRRETGVLAAVPGVDDDPPPDQLRTAVHEGGALSQQLGASAGDLAAQLAQ